MTIVAQSTWEGLTLMVKHRFYCGWSLIKIMLTKPIFDLIIFRYLAGTEEGHIHKCSCSYNEQYLESYNGHTVSSLTYINCKQVFNVFFQN